MALISTKDLGVKPRGTRLGIRKGEKGAVRLPKILVLRYRVKTPCQARSARLPQFGYPLTHPLPHSPTHSPTLPLFTALPSSPTRHLPLASTFFPSFPVLEHLPPESGARKRWVLTSRGACTQSLHGATFNTALFSFPAPFAAALGLAHGVVSSHGVLLAQYWGAPPPPRPLVKPLPFCVSFSLAHFTTTVVKKDP